MKIRSAFFIFVLIVCLLGSLGCYMPEETDIAAEVGGVIITKQEVADYFMTKQYVVDAIIWEKIVILECNERGISLDGDKYEGMISGVIEQNGGAEVFAEQLSKTGNTLEDVYTAIKMQILDGQLLEDIIGDPAEEDILGLWNEKKDDLKRSLATQMEKSEAEVTLEDARESIIQDWKGSRYQEVSMTFKDDLKAKWGVKNYYSGEGLELTEVVEKIEEVVPLKGSGEIEEHDEAEHE